VVGPVVGEPPTPTLVELVSAEEPPPLPVPDPCDTAPELQPAAVNASHDKIHLLRQIIDSLLFVERGNRRRLARMGPAIRSILTMCIS